MSLWNHLIFRGNSCLHSAVGRQEYNRRVSPYDFFLSCLTFVVLCLVIRIIQDGIVSSLWHVTPVQLNDFYRLF